jgi:hypothetical protein
MVVGESISQKGAPRRTLSGPRLDRLPISGFHRRIFWLVGAGMFFDGYDLYVGTNVLQSIPINCDRNILSPGDCTRPVRDRFS